MENDNDRKTITTETQFKTGYSTGEPLSFISQRGGTQCLLSAALHFFHCQLRVDFNKISNETRNWSIEKKRHWVLQPILFVHSCAGRKSEKEITTAKSQSSSTVRVTVTSNFAVEKRRIRIYAAQENENRLQFTHDIHKTGLKEILMVQMKT